MPRGRKSANSVSRPVARNSDEFSDSEEGAVDERLTTDDVRALTGRNSLESSTRMVHCSDEYCAD